MAIVRQNPAQARQAIEGRARSDVLGHRETSAGS